MNRPPPVGRGPICWVGDFGPLAQSDSGCRHLSLLLVLSAPALVSLALPPVPLLAGSLTFLADFVMRSLTDLSVEPPAEVALGRLNAPFRPGRTRLPCVPPAAGTLVWLAVDLIPTRFPCEPPAAVTLVLLAVDLSPIPFS